MSITGIKGSLVRPQDLVSMRQQLNELQRQLGTGRKSETYGGLGADRSTALSLRARMSSVSSFMQSIDTLGVRLSVTQKALDRFGAVAQEAKADTRPISFSIDSGGQSTAQIINKQRFAEMVSLLNTRVGDRSLFGGTALDRDAVANETEILEGSGSKAGLKQVIAERRQADIGANGLGRLNAPTVAGSTVAVAEDGAHPFGLKVSAITSTISGATITAPAGAAPQSMSIDLTSQPKDGDTVRFSFTLPDGSSEDLTLTATTANPPGVGQFSIGANTGATASSLRDALQTGLDTMAHTSLVAASAMQASQDFFDIDDSAGPRRVNGPPFDSATGFVATDTRLTTVAWYKGEGGPGPARATAQARIDESITIQYGARANEQALRWQLQSVGVIAATTFSVGDPNAEEAYFALMQRAGGGLDSTAGTQRVDAARTGRSPTSTSAVQKLDMMQTEIAGTQVAMAAAKSRHKTTHDVAGEYLTQIEGVTTEEVAAKLLTLQTQLQASLQTTANLSKLSLINYM